MKILYLVLILVLTVSCKQNNDKKRILKELNSYYNRKIEFYDILDIKGNIVNFNNDMQNNNKIILYIDSVYCVPCTLENIKLWRKYEMDLLDLNTEIILLTNNADKKGTCNLLKELDIQYELFFDSSGKLKSKYDLLCSKVQSFVVDSNNRVIWIGSPIQSHESWSKFKKKMKKSYN